MSAETLRKQIFVGCRELGLDRETRHDLQLNVTGKSSLTDMDERELKLVVDALRAKGFVVQGRSRKKAGRKDVRLIHVLWKKLDEAGALRQPGREGLNAFIRSQFGSKWGAVPADVDMLTDASQINQVVQALKAMGKANAIDFDWGLYRR